jgi:hypothetical protein
MKAVVTGMIATYPVGGVVWDYAQYALGLEQLGFEVLYLEDAGTPTYDPAHRTYGADPTYGVQFLENALNALSPRLAGRWHFRSMDDACYGMNAPAVADFVAQADLFLNVSGSAMLRDSYRRSPCKVLIDTDPGWNHFVNYPKADALPEERRVMGYRSHDHFFTYATNIGRSDCMLPTLGIDWKSTVPPVVSDRWIAEPPGRTWTTVMTWDNFRRTIRHGDREYGTKEREFSVIESLPQNTSATLEVAVGGASPPVERWRSQGWTVVDSHDISQTHEDYRHYIQRSRGELSVAKNVYVATRSGWFSCRSVCYLAAGLPVVVQDTGFREHLPTGEGLLTFTTLEEAIGALDAVENDYDYHARKARDVARAVFDSRVVIGQILDEVGLT